MKSNHLAYQGILGAALVIALSGCAIADGGSAPLNGGLVVNPIDYGQDADTSGVEFVMSSNDTFAEVVDNAVGTQGASVVAAALGDSARLASSGGDLGWPELAQEDDSVSLGQLFGSVAAAVAAGDDLPIEATETTFLDSPVSLEAEPFDDDLAVATAAVNKTGLASSAEGFDASGSLEVSLAEAINNGRTWQDTYWIRVLITTGGGGYEETDKVSGTVTVDPGAVTSRIGYKSLYFPSTNKFTAINYSTQSFEGDVMRGWDGHYFDKSSGSADIYLQNDISMRGRLLNHVTELSAFVGGRLYNDIRGTGTAVCETSTNVCKY